MSLFRKYKLSALLSPPVDSADSFVWSAAQDNRTFDGGAGVDSLRADGAITGDSFTLRASGGRVLIDRIVGTTPATATLDNIERVQINSGAGNDVVQIRDLSGTEVTALHVDGGTGRDAIVFAGSAAADSLRYVTVGTQHWLFRGSVPTVVTANAVEELTLLGGDGDDLLDASNAVTSLVLTLDGGAGNDRLIGSSGNDVLLGGTGNDVFTWNPAGNDRVFGQEGSDTLLAEMPEGDSVLNVPASNGAVALHYSGLNTPLSAEVAAAGIEQLSLELGAGHAIVLLNDLTRTGITRVDIENLPADGARDDFWIEANSGPQDIAAITVQGETIITGTPAKIHIRGATSGEVKDGVVLQLGNASDTVDLTQLQPDLLQFYVQAGGGDDTIYGSSGTDQVDSGPGKDSVDLGAGNDAFYWEPTHGNDTVEGGTGTFDILTIRTQAPGSRVEAAASDGRLVVTETRGGSADATGFEALQFRAGEGDDTLIISDLSNSSVRQVGVFFGLFLNPDTGNDSVTVRGTADNDTVRLRPDGDVIRIDGLVASVLVFDAIGNDSIRIDLGAGDDLFDASALPTPGTQLFLTGGAGSDIFAGAATVTDFDVAQDRLDVRSLAPGETFEQVMARATQFGDAIVFDFGDQHVLTLNDVSLDALGIGNFIL
jgi:Ca2+-binding RTX toxin-like protein